MDDNSLNNKKIIGGGRESNLELYRIISMLLIVAHHYLANSGLVTALDEQSVFHFKDYFLLVFGAWGKTGINCFVLITGYFMCTSHITKKKFLKLVGERYFYAIVIFLIFFLTGYEQSPLKSLIKTVYPLYSIEQNFTTCFFLFYLLIPFLNMLVNAMGEKSHRLLLLWCMAVYVIMPSIPKARISFNYVTWFCILYIIASYIRLYPMRWMEDNRIVGGLMAVSILFSIASVVVIAYLTRNFNRSVLDSYFFVSDSNKVFAVSTGVTSFLFFRNLKIKNSKVINSIAASTFGVLLIHANSSTMRQWLWKDVCKVVKVYESGNCILHAILCVLAIYVVCTLIDMLRIFIGKNIQSLKA